MSDPTQQPTPPIAGAQAPHIVEPHIPHVPIPHMGTSRADVPMPSFAASAAADVPVAAPATKPVVAPNPLPDGVTQDMIHAAIQQVEQTGKTDGIAPQVLIAACQQIEAQAAQQGIDLSQIAPAPSGQPAPPPPANYVEAAVMDKKGTFDNFTRQRDSLKSSVADQRKAAQRPYQDALQKAHGGGGGGGGGEGETVDEAAMMKVLAAELSALDPQTIALINAMGVLSNTPEVLKSLVWLEIIRAVRNLIASQTKQQVEACLKATPAA